jgi:ADP-ribose pyrophosphatase
MPGGAAEPGTGDAHLVEHRIDSEVRLSGGFLTVLRDRVRLPDGATATREYIRHPGAVAVVPILDDGRLVLVRQYRHPVGRVLLEWPAGKLDGGEPALACAVRELREETGYRAREWARAGVFHNACAYSDEGIEIWFARGLVEGAASLDAGEFVEVRVLDADALQALVLSGEVTDMKTVLGLLWLQRWRCGGWPADWQPAP